MANQNDAENLTAKNLKVENLELQKRLDKRQKTNEFWQVLVLMAILGWPGLTMIFVIWADFFLKLRSDTASGIDATLGNAIVQGMSSVMLAAVTGILSYLGGAAHGREEERRKQRAGVTEANANES